MSRHAIDAASRSGKVPSALALAPALGLYLAMGGVWVTLSEAVLRHTTADAGLHALAQAAQAVTFVLLALGVLGVVLLHMHRQRAALASLLAARGRLGTRRARFVERDVATVRVRRDRATRWPTQA